MGIIKTNLQGTQELPNFIAKVYDTNVYVGNINENTIANINSVVSSLPVNTSINIILQNKEANEIINGEHVLIKLVDNLYTITFENGQSYSIYTINETKDLYVNGKSILSSLQSMSSNIVLGIITDDTESLLSSYNEFVAGISSNIFLENGTILKLFYRKNNEMISLGEITIESEKTRYANSRLLYKVGLVSDVHYNDVDANDIDPYTVNTSETSEFFPDLRNAFTVFSQEHVDFVSCCGDITTAEKCTGGRENHLNNFMYCYNTFGNNLSFFTTVGNHDCFIQNLDKSGSAYKWTDIDAISTNENIAPIRINDSYQSLGRIYNDPVGTSFYFIYKNDVYIYLNVCYGTFAEPGSVEISGSSFDTHHPRILTSDEWNALRNLNICSEYEGDAVDSSNDYHLYNVDTIKWLIRIFDMYWYKRCFVFTHIMFDDGAGTYHGNAYYKYYNTHTDVIRGIEGYILKKLRDTYPKSIWFGGHSHLEFKWETVDNESIVCKHSAGSYTVHIPSLALPLRISTDYYTDPYNSEFAIMNVYNTHITIDGYIAKDQHARYDGSSMLQTYTQSVSPSSLTLRSFTAEDVQYFNISTYSDDVSPSTVSYVSSGTYAGYLCFTLSNYHFFTFLPQMLKTDNDFYNSVYVVFDDIQIVPCEPTESGYDVSEYTEAKIRESAEAADVDFEGFGIYSNNSTYITPDVNYSNANLLATDITYGVVFRLSQIGFRWIANSKYDAYLRKFGYKIYAKMRYAIYNEPTKPKRYMNKKTIFSNYLLEVTQ